jgi:hypothetical protein
MSHTPRLQSRSCRILLEATRRCVRTCGSANGLVGLPRAAVFFTGIGGHVRVSVATSSAMAPLLRLVATIRLQVVGSVTGTTKACAARVMQARQNSSTLHRGRSAMLPAVAVIKETCGHTQLQLAEPLGIFLIESSYRLVLQQHEDPCTVNTASICCRAICNSFCASFSNTAHLQVKPSCTSTMCCSSAAVDGAAASCASKAAGSCCNQQWWLCAADCLRQGRQDAHFTRMCPRLRTGHSAVVHTWLGRLVYMCALSGCRYGLCAICLDSDFRMQAG